MCGIAGFSGQFENNLLAAMGERIAHRGPDDSGEAVFTNGNNKVGLAHRRLSIIDLSADGQQPLNVVCRCCHSTQQDGLWLTYNGELYNYQSLRKELMAKGHTFHTKTDSEVLLHLYAEEGLNMLQRLNGIFSFAIYDGRSDQQKDGVQRGDLFIARDGVGVKPLYYSETESGFLFASEIKALLASNELDSAIDPVAIHYYLAYLWCPGQQTALEHVKKIDPGQAFLVRNGIIAKRWQYYDLPYKGVVSTSSQAAISEELSEHLSRAVKRQLVADVPVGAFLSGGLDSSAVVAMMRKHLPEQEIQCYCIGFRDGMKSEGNSNDVPYARKVAKHLNVKLDVLEVEADIIKHLPTMLYHLDEPQADPAPIHVYLIAEAAKRKGIKVLLSGAGGDDIFSGYGRHRALQIDTVYNWLPKKVRNGVSGYAQKVLEGRSSLRNMQKPIPRRLAKLFAHSSLPPDRRIASHFLWSTENLRRNLYSPDMAAHVLGTDTVMPLLYSLTQIPDEQNDLNRMLYLEGKHFLASHNLNYTDKMSMAMGIEVRVPLLDPDLIAFAATIPARMKQKGSVGKAIFKKSMEAYLPKDVIYRKKAGFGAPLRHWLNHELRDFVRDTLSESTLKRRGIFDHRAVTRLLEWNQQGRVDGAYTIFSLLCIELWSQIFVDKRAVSQHG